MSLNKGQDRIFNLIEGNVLTSGGTLNLANGQLAILDLSQPNTQNGRPAASVFTGRPKGTDFQIKVGTAPLAATRSITDKPWSSKAFNLSEIVSLDVAAPKVGGNTHDEFIIGYNGKAGTEIVLKKDSSDQIDITLSGEAIGALGYQDNQAKVTLYLEHPYVDADGLDTRTGLVPTMQEIVENAVKTLSRMELMGGVSILDYIDIAPVNSLSPSLVDITNEVEYTNFTLTIADSGDHTALGKIQAQYPTYTVKVLERLETETVYSILTVSATGVTPTVIPAESESGTAWVAGEVGNAIPEAYTITLADKEAGGNFLAEVQAYYPDLTITAGASALCQTTYTASDVFSNVVSEGCSDEFRGLFITEAPSDYKGISWEGAAKVYNAAAKMGIKITGKDFIMSGTEEYRDDMPFYNTSTRISIAGGYTTMTSENFIAGNGRFAVKRLSIATETEGLGGQLRDQEERSRRYFDGTERLEGNNYGKWALGQESRLKGLAQYVDYTLTVDIKTPVMNLGTGNERIHYTVRVEVGKQAAVETLLNALATAAGIPTVTAYA